MQDVHYTLRESFFKCVLELPELGARFENYNGRWAKRIRINKYLSGQILFKTWGVADPERTGDYGSVSRENQKDYSDTVAVAELVSLKKEAEEKFYFYSESNCSVQHKSSARDYSCGSIQNSPVRIYPIRTS